MSLVRPVCDWCGAQTEALAVVMDPFRDACYGVCQSCMTNGRTGTMKPTDYLVENASTDVSGLER